MRAVVRRSVVLLAIAASAVVWSAPARAVENESFGISPQPEVVNGVNRSSFEIPREVGATYQDAVRVYNKTDQPLDLELYAADAQISGGSSVSVGFKDQHPKGVGTWITLSRTKVSLAPRGDATVTFAVDVKSSSPSPAIGAIVVENTARGLAADLSERLNILVHTVPPNSPTTSKRVRPYLLRSPWVIVAIIGLVGVLALVLVGWRRSRRTRDKVVPAGEVEQAEHLQPIPVASLPVIRRLGKASADDDAGDDQSRPLLDDDLLVEVDEPLFIDDSDDYDDEDVAYEDEDEALAEDEDDEGDDVEHIDLPPARQRPAAKPAPRKAAKVTTERKPEPRKPAAKRKPPAKRKPAAKRKPVARAPKPTESNYIPLEDL